MSDNPNTAPGGKPTGGILAKASKFIVGKGFYIVLILCVAAIAISGYVILTTTTEPEVPNLPDPSDLGLSSTVPVQTTAPRVTTPEKPVDGTTVIPNNTTPPPATTPDPGTKPVENLFYSKPVAGTLLRHYSDTTPVYNPTMDDWRIHTGIDIAAPVGTSVLAVAAGTVSSVYSDYFKGNIVELSHADGRVSVYCGLAEFGTLKAGDKVTSGTVIGTIGETGIFESLDEPHLHFEMKKDGKYINPLDFLPTFG